MGFDPNDQYGHAVGDAVLAEGLRGYAGLFDKVILWRAWVVTNSGFYWIWSTVRAIWTH